MFYMMWFSNALYYFATFYDRYVLATNICDDISMSPVRACQLPTDRVRLILHKVTNVVHLLSIESS